MPMITLATPFVASAVALAFMATWMIELLRHRVSGSELDGSED